MAWSYSLKNKFRDPNGLHVIANFLSDDGTNYNKTFNINIVDDLKVQIQNELNRLATHDTTDELIPTSGQLTDLTPTLDPVPVIPNIDPSPTPVTADPILSKRIALSAALNDFNIKLIDQATYDQKVQDILNAK